MPTVELALMAGGALVLSVLLTGLMRRYALARGILDAPNARSSHTRVTPRGGGIAIVAAMVAGVAVGLGAGIIDARLAAALCGGGIAVAWIGFADDRSPVSVGKRLLIHFAAAAWAVFILGGLPPLQVGEAVRDLGTAGDVFAVVAVVWIINLFNFMDGIDGIAGGEAVTIAAVGGLLALSGGMGGVAAAAFVLAAASGGFLVWNWPPARIFMGDVGSGFLGFAIAVLGLAAARESPTAPWVWLMLGGVFMVDATVTIVRRILRRVNLSDAHREHAYQRLSRRWKGHLPVLLATLSVNVLWLSPLAWFAASNPDLGLGLAALTLAPLVVIAVVAGAGKPEET
jgi:Fuc2NAc and GlcNAc transferase